MRLLHTMLRVGDMDKSIAFYTEVPASQGLPGRSIHLGVCGLRQ